MFKSFVGSSCESFPILISMNFLMTNLSDCSSTLSSYLSIYLIYPLWYLNGLIWSTNIYLFGTELFRKYKITKKKQVRHPEFYFDSFVKISGQSIKKWKNTLKRFQVTRWHLILRWNGKKNLNDVSIKEAVCLNKSQSHCVW